MRWLSSAAFMYRRIYKGIEFQRAIGTGAWGDPTQGNSMVAFTASVSGVVCCRGAGPAASVEQPG